MQRFILQLTVNVNALLIHPDRQMSNPGSSGHIQPDQKTTTSMPTTSFEDPFFPLVSEFGRLVEGLLNKPAMLTEYDDGYHKLQFFSGKVPTPSGEDDFDIWIDKAIQAVEEWEETDIVKRQRVVESLRAPALEAIRNLKRDKPCCTTSECLGALCEVYGRIENGAELIYLFNHTYQMEGEKLTAYVVWLDHILHPVIIKSDVEAKAESRTLM